MPMATETPVIHKQVNRWRVKLTEADRNDATGAFYVRGRCDLLYVDDEGTTTAVDAVEDVFEGPELDAALAYGLTVDGDLPTKVMAALYFAFKAQGVIPLEATYVD